MSRIQRAITFENVLVTVVAFVVLSGGVAYAATHLAKNSVGTGQLKKSSVTAAKIKKNAVTSGKIRKGAVTSAKVADGAIAAGAFNPATNPFSGVVATLGGGSGTVPINKMFGNSELVPLTNPTFVQQPGEIDYVIGQVQVEFTGGCAASKLLGVEAAYDSPDIGATSFDNRIVSEGFVLDEDEGPNPLTLPLIFAGKAAIPKVSTPTTRTFTLSVGALCGGKGSVAVSNIKLEVIGVKA